jgi:hypothetical protein
MASGKTTAGCASRRAPRSLVRRGSKREPEAKERPDVKPELEVKEEPEIKKQRFTIRGYFGFA